MVPLGLTKTASGTDAAIQKKIFGWEVSALIISNLISISKPKISGRRVIKEDEGVIPAGEGPIATSQGQVTIRAVQGFSSRVIL